MATMNRILHSGYHMFDNKYLIVKPWTPDTPLTKDIVNKVFVWVRLYGVDLLFSGMTCLAKFSNEIDNFLKCDDATMKRSRLEYARLLVELEINQQLSIVIDFLDEEDKHKCIRVDCEWLPVTCSNFKGFGHKEDARMKNIDNKKVR
ncbi:hypothetical protein vseg_015230 [Gypsophila vaccaria]